MTNKERNKLAAAIFELRGNSCADQNTVIALAQAIERAFDADPKFSNFACSATALFTNIDYRKNLVKDAPLRQNAQELFSALQGMMRLRSPDLLTNEERAAVINNAIDVMANITGEPAQ